VNAITIVTTYVVVSNNAYKRSKKLEEKQKKRRRWTRWEGGALTSEPGYRQVTARLPPGYRAS